MTIPVAFDVSGLYERLTTLRREQFSHLTADEARAYGFDLDPGWAVDIIWEEDQPKYTFVSPENWRFSDFSYADTGDVLDYFAISPEGTRYSKAELEALSTPQPIAQTPIEVPYMYQELLNMASEDPEGFIRELQRGGSTPDKETVLRASLQGAVHIDTGLPFTTEEIDQLVTDVFSEQVTEIGQALMAALPARVDETTVNWATDYFGKNPDKLRQGLIAVGKNEATEKLVKLLYPQITEQGMADYFTPDSFYGTVATGQGAVFAGVAQPEEPRNIWGKIVQVVQKGLDAIQLAGSREIADIKNFVGNYMTTKVLVPVKAGEEYAFTTVNDAGELIVLKSGVWRDEEAAEENAKRASEKVT